MRLRLFLSFALVVLVTVASMVLVARATTAHEVRGFMFRGGMSGVEGLVADLEAHYREQRSWEGAEALLGQAGHGAGRRAGGQGAGQGGMAGMMGRRLRLADAAGVVVADAGGGGNAVQPGAGAGGRLQGDELEAAIPLEVDGETAGYLLVEGSIPFDPMDEAALLARLNRTALTAGLIAGGFALLVALLLGYRLEKPVRALTQAAVRLAQGDLSQRVEASGDEELAALGVAFNRMAASLQQAEQGRRALTADIAHELRNPLAVQRAHLEALQDGLYPATPENLGPILEQNLLLTRLVEDLRTLALADSGELRLERRPTDLAGLVERCLERFRPQAEARRARLLFSPPTDCPPLSLDPDRVEQILGNLLSNALRYVPEGGRIELALECTPAAASLSVRDDGPGIPAEALPRLFERFYRVDRARSRSEGGSGLGLAIARQLAEAHGGSLTAANHPQGGAIFTLTLPMA